MEGQSLILKTTGRNILSRLEHQIWWKSQYHRGTLRDQWCPNRF